jgi:hypothetical protein
MPPDDAEKLKERIAALPPWQRDDFSDEEWKKYVSVAKLVQSSDPETVESALEEFTREAINEEFRGYASESKPFLLMRVVFDLPEGAPESERRSFKGWVNWPAADSRGEVSLAWPLSWRSGKPRLVAPYAGSEGIPYAAVSEYRHLREHYPYRELSEASEDA